MDAAFVREVVAFRRSLHEEPETGFKEVDTHKRILAELAKLDIAPADIHVMACTGIVADIRGTAAALATSSDGSGDEDVIIAVRSDIDALPMTEDTGSLPWQSKRPRAAHMCGHDGHMANLLGLARLVCARRDRLPCNRVLRLLWQPAEEGPGGAKPMVEEGAMEGVAEVYGFHNWPAFPLGSVHVAAGPVMAHVTDFDIAVRGRGGHASQPHVLADPVVAAAHCVVAAQTVVSRSVYAGDAAVVSFSTIHGGETRNVIPTDVTMTGTIRDLSPDASAVICERFPAVVKATAEAHGCTADVSVRSVYPILRNDAAAASHCERIGKAVLGETRVASWGLPLMGGEDFGYFSEQAPGCYVFFGTAEEERENHMLHSSHFDFNDRVLPRTITFFLRLLEDRWGLRAATSSADSVAGSAAAASSSATPVDPLYTEDEVPGFASSAGVPAADFRTAPPASAETSYTADVSCDATAMGHAV